MKTVRMRHPGAGESAVPASAVPHWRACGWEVVPEEPERAGSEREKEAAAGPDGGVSAMADSGPKTAPKSAGRRRTRKEDE